MTGTLESHVFQAETQQLLDLMIHSLYAHREVFLRELVSNASDALDKLRVLALADPALREAAGEPLIRLEPRPAERLLVIEDNGIGMTRDEVIENIGTIARSGSQGFLEELRRARGQVRRGEAEGQPPPDAPELIGRFGVGFYSAFMVAEKIVLETRRAGTAEGVRWSSAGDGTYTLESFEKQGSGTRVVLHLRPHDPEDEDAQDFTDAATLRAVVKRYSDFVAHPIFLDGEVVNSRTPLWTRPRAEIGADEYRKFSQHLAHDGDEPLATIHFRGEGTHDYTALLYLPCRRPADGLDPTQRRARVSLYVRRVFVTKECEELLPPWLRFVHGVVDSADLPLNVSRETLQHNRQIRQIRRRLVRKILETLGECREKDRARYEAFWTQLGPILKEGLCTDDEHRDELFRVCLWPSTAAQPAGAGQADAARATSWTTLGEYVERMPFAQKAIWYVLGAERSLAERSPHLEVVRAKGWEVLYFVDPVDEWVAQRQPSFEGKPLRAIDRGELDLDDEAGKASRAARQKELSGLLEAVRESLDDYVGQVRLSSRLKESAAVLVSEEGALSPAMEHVLRAAGQNPPSGKRVLELNPEHPVLARLQSLYAASRGEGEAARDAAQELHVVTELLHGQALLAEGSPLPDPARLAQLIGRLLVPGKPVAT